MSKASNQFSLPSAGARDDDFECAHDSGSSQRSLGTILKRLHACLMMSVKIGIFLCRGVCAFTLAKREEQSSFSFFLSVGVQWVQIFSRGFTIYFCQKKIGHRKKSGLCVNCLRKTDVAPFSFVNNLDIVGVPETKKSFSS